MSLFDRPHLLRPQASLQVDRPALTYLYEHAIHQAQSKSWCSMDLRSLVLSWMGYGQQASMLWPQTGQLQYKHGCSIRSTILLGLRFRGQVNVKVQGARMTSILAHKSTTAPADGSWFADASRSLGAAVAPV